MAVLRADTETRGRCRSRLSITFFVAVAALALFACKASVGGVAFPGGDSKKKKTEQPQPAPAPAATTDTAGAPAPAQPAAGGSTTPATTPAPAAGGAKPLDRNSEIALKRAKANFAKIQIKPGLRKNVPVERADEVAKEHSSVSQYIDYTHQSLRMLRQWDKDHPEVVAFYAEIAKAEAYMKDLAALVAAHNKVLQANKDLRNQFFKDYWSEHSVLTNYYYQMDHPDEGSPYGEQSKLAEAKKALAKIHSGCTGKYKSLANDPTGHPNDRTRNPALMCRAAAMGDELVKLRVVAMAKYVLNSSVKAMKDQLAAMDQDDGYLKKADLDLLYDPDSVKKTIKERYGKDLAFVGAKLGPEIFAEADKAREALLAEIPKHVPRWKFRAHGSKAKDGFVTQSYKKAGKGVKVLQIQLLNKKWTVKLNALGVPKYRFKRGGILFKIKGEDWCHDEAFVYYQDYQGGKRYGKSYYEHPPKKLKHTRIVSCK